MAPPAKPEEFLDLVAKSNIVDSDRLANYLAEQGGPLSGDPRRLASQFVRDGLLTPFHVQHLLQGKWRGFHIGKYRVLQPLGAGGMGQVFLCEHPQMKRLVAVKVLPSHALKDSSALPRLIREARALAQLDHPNVVRAYDIDQDAKMNFLVLEFVDGVSLQQLVDKRGPLAVPRACNFIAQAALGLGHAHEQGLVHRDIKPGNVLLDRSGVVKLLDLGLARMFHGSTDKITQQFDPNSVLGTADYLAPEQTIDSSVDIRADIYSLGCTLFFLLTGRSPFQDSTTAQKLLFHQFKPIPSPRDFRKDVPDGLVKVLAAMTAKDRAERYQLPNEVVDAVSMWTGPSEPPPDEDLPRWSSAVRALSQSRPTPEPPRPPASGTAITSSPRQEREPPQPFAEPDDLATTVRPRSQRRGWLTVVIVGGVVLVLAAVGLFILLTWGSSLGGSIAVTTPTHPEPEPAVAITPAEALKRVNENHTVEMLVRRARQSNARHVYLNSEWDYMSDTNFTIMIPEKAVELFKKGDGDALAVHFQGRTIRVNGRIEKVNGKPAIVVNSPDRIELMPR
jgi:serine/threonine protein kinase